MFMLDRIWTYRWNYVLRHHKHLHVGSRCHLRGTPASARLRQQGVLEL
jgi:hypothetical protein